MNGSWRVMLKGATEEALLAVDLYNQPRQPRRLEGFLVHMHIAWLYLLHAELRKEGVDYRYKLPNGRLDRIDGEPKTWDLRKCVSHKWPAGGPVRKNLELSIGLRNKVEHRYHEALSQVVAGYAQALLLNFEAELTNYFGDKNSLGDQLRFPIFVGSITALGQLQLQQLRNSLPRDARDFIARFEADLDPAIAQDQRYEFRINLVPKLGSKTQADAAMTFVREDQLTDDEKKHLKDLGKSGQVVVREQTRPVASEGLYKPSIAAQMIEARVPFKVRVHHVVRAWKALGCRPPSGSDHPERTDARYCIYDQPHGDYLFTPAFVTKVARELSTAKKFRNFVGLEAQPK
jgi:hypothetical protein